MGQFIILKPLTRKTGSGLSSILPRILFPAVLAFGFFISGNAEAQTTNVFWDGAANGTYGGTGSLNTGTARFSTNGPGGAGPYVPPNNALYILNFGGATGTVTQSSGTVTNSGMNWLSSGYTFSTGVTNARVWLGSNAAIAYITNNANLNIIGTGVGNPSSLTISSMNLNGGAGSTVTLSNNTGETFSLIFGTSSATSGRTNSVNTIVNGAGRITLGTAGSSGFVQSGNITNNSTGGLVLSNGASGDITFSGSISGSGAVVLTNASSGTFWLTASNSYAGGTTIFATNSSSIIAISNSAAFGSGPVTIAGVGTNYIRNYSNNIIITNAIAITNGGVLRIATTNSGWKGTYSGVISGGGGIVTRFTDTQILPGINNSFGGGINIASSTKVQVVSIGMAGSNSSLGTNGVVTFSSDTGTGGAGELYWLGANSETSDKTFALTSVSSSASAGMKIYAGDNNSGGTNVTLTLNGDINCTGATNSITLGAYNTNTLVINGMINQTAGTNSLVVGNTGVGTVVLANANNNFGGPVTINAGSSSTNTVQVTTVGNAGSSSSLGTNGTINIGGGSSTGVNILKYVGSGETSDKRINMSSSFGGATLEQAGAGNLKFTSAMTATGVGAKTVTLQGSTSGTGELAAGLSDAGGNVISLVKNGSGAWILSGNNTYSGNTTLNAGTLILSGVSTGAGLVTLSSTSSVLQLMITNALNNGILVGTSSGADAGMVNVAVGENHSLNSYGSIGNGGGNMVFTNSSGSSATLTFTAPTNYVTASSSTSGGRGITNLSANLTLIFNGAVDIGSSTSADVTFTGPGNFTILGSLFNTNATGVRALTKSGAGTLTLSASNNYNGETKISAGTLSLTAARALGTNAVTLSGTLRVNNSGTNESKGNLTVTGNSTIDLGTVSSGELRFQSATNWTTGRILTVANSSVGAKLYFTVTNGVPLSQIQSAENPTATPTLASDGLLTFSSGVVAPSGLSYTPSSVTGTVGAAISDLTPSVTGSVTSYSVNPALPAGLSLNTSTGVISGTPTVVANSASYTVTASNSGGSTTASVTIVVNAVAPSSLSYSSSSVTGTVGTAISDLTPSVTGSVTSYSVNPALPAGLSLNTSTGVISGTPTAVANSASYTVTASNSGGSTTAAVTIVVNAVAPSGLSYTPSSVTGTVGTAISDLTPSVTGSVTGYSVSPALPAGLSLDTSTGVISGTPSAVASSTIYTVTASNSGGSTTAAVTIVVNAVAPSALSYSSSSVTGTVGTAISDLTPSVTGSVTGYSVSPALPAGLSLDTSTGVISGTPSAVASSTIYTVTASNSGGSTTASVTIVVNAAGPTFDSAYANKNLMAVAPNGLTYLVNYAFGGSDTTDPKLPVQDTTDPKKLALVAYVRTGDTSISVSGEAAASLDFGSASNAPFEVIENSDAPAGMEKRSYSVSVGGDRKFLRLKVTKQ